MPSHSTWETDSKFVDFSKKTVLLKNFRKKFVIVLQQCLKGVHMLAGYCGGEGYSLLQLTLAITHHSFF